MVDRLPVRADGRDISGSQPGFEDACKRRAGKVFPQLEVQLANLRDGPVQAEIQDPAPHGRGKRPMRVRHDARPQFAPAARNRRHHRINAIG